MSILKKFLGANTVGAEKIRLESDSALRARNAANSADVDLFKLDSADVLKLLKLPRVDAALASPANAKDLVTKEYVDSSVSSGVLDLIGQPDGIAPLGHDGKIPNQFYSSLVITDVFVVADIAARDALTGIETGDVVKVVDAGAGLPKTYIWGGSPAGYIEIESGSDVDSVNGYTGTVVLASSDIAESGATNRYYTPARQSAIESYAANLEALDLRLDGSRPMQGDIAMAQHSITNAGLIDVLSGDGTFYVDITPDTVAISNDTSGTSTSLTASGLTAQVPFSVTVAGDLTLAPQGGGAVLVQSDLNIADYTVNLSADIFTTAIQGGQITITDTDSTADAAFSPTSITYSQGASFIASSGDFEIGAPAGIVQMNSPVAMTNHKITGLENGVDPQDAVSKSQLDSAVIDATAAANSYTDGQVALIQAEDGTFLKSDGSRPMTGALDMNNSPIRHLPDPTDQTDAANRSYVDTAASNVLAAAESYASGLIPALEAADLTFLKLDGSRAMTDDLNMGGHGIGSLGSITMNGSIVGVTSLSNASTIQVSAMTFDVNAGITLNNNLIHNLGSGVQNTDAVNVGQLSAGVAEAKSYTDAQLDTLSVQELVHASVTLTGADVSNGYVDVSFPIQGQPWIQVGRVSLVPGDDFSVSGSRITFAGPIAAGQPEALESGDKLSIYYHKAVSPFV